MSGYDWASVIIAAVCSVAMLVICLRTDHYIRTGRWFR